VVVVGPAEAGRPVEKVLARRLEGASWAHVGRLLRQGRVLDGARPLARGERVVRGQRLTIEPAPEQTTSGLATSGQTTSEPATSPTPDASPVSRERPPPTPNRRLRVRVVHEDPDLLVVDKAPGVPVHPGPGHGTDTLQNALVARYPELLALGAGREWGLVHRLDRDTSGLLVIARSVAAYEGLVAAFQARTITKEYLALVAGRPPARAGGGPAEVATPVEGKAALTRYEVVETIDLRRGERASLVRAWPVTGRMHQVRVHLAALGCPVLGEARHAPDATPAGPRVPRLALHAHRLALAHPVTGAPLSFEAALPRDLRRAWDGLRRRAAAIARGRATDPGAPPEGSAEVEGAAPRDVPPPAIDGTIVGAREARRRRGRGRGSGGGRAGR
jgi:23S rRNA pseudouridine1911/1915/1917 synthase